MEATSLEDDPRTHFNQPHRPLNEAGKGVLATLGVFWTVAIASVALRFYVRYIRGGVYHLEDYVILLGLAVFIGFGVVSILLVCKAGMGWHSVELPPDQLQLLMKLVLSAQCLFAVSLGSVKISITMFIFRAFTNQETAFRVAGGIVLVFTILWTIATLLVTFLICRPITLLWSLLPVNGMCGDPRAAYVSIAATDILADMMIILLPQPVIWRLHLPVRLKIAITGVVGIGMLSIGMGIARLVGMAQTDWMDWTTATNDVYWSLIEISTGIFTCCAPSFHFLIRRWVGNISSSSMRETQSRVPAPYDKQRRKSSWFSCWRRRGCAGYGASSDDLPLSYYTTRPQLSNRPQRSNVFKSVSGRTLPVNEQWTMTGNMHSADDSGVGGILVEKSITTY